MSEIDELLAEWTAAERAGDAAALDKLLTDDFVGVGPLGFTLSKREWLDRYDGGLRYETFGLEDVQVRGYGDAALNNAAGGHRPTPLAEVAIEDFDSELAVSLRGVFLAMRYEIPAMLDTGGGSIVNMASTAGLEAVGGLAGYVSSKFGVVGLTRTAALDYADCGIRVNALAPGPILTETLERAGQQAQERTAGSLPMRRLGRPEEVAGAAVWLCSAQSSFVTGATLTVDGGMLAGMPTFSRAGAA